MTGNLISRHPPLKAFFTPLDVATPMRRVDFWTFYLGYCVVLTPAFLLIDLVLRFAATQSGGVMTAGGLITALAILFYLIAIFLSAITRRLVDSGFWRISVPLFIGLFITSFGAFVGRLAQAWEPGTAPRMQPVPDVPDLSLWTALAALIVSGYMFYGLIGRSRPAPGESEPSDNGV